MQLGKNINCKKLYFLTLSFFLIFFLIFSLIKLAEINYRVAHVQGVFQFLKNNYRCRLVLINGGAKLGISRTELLRTYCFILIT